MVGTRWLASGGMAIIGAGLILLSALPAQPSLPSLVGDLVIVGVGMAVLQLSQHVRGDGSVPRAQLGVAAGTLGTMRFLGQTLSIGVLGASATSRLGAGGQAVLLTGQPRARERQQPTYPAITSRCWRARASPSSAQSPPSRGQATATV